MKKLIAIAFLFAACSPGVDKNVLCSGDWILYNKYNLDSNVSYHPLARKMVFNFKQDGTADYEDNGKPKNELINWHVDGDKIRIIFQPDYLPDTVTFLVEKIEPKFLWLNTSPETNDKIHNTTYIFVKSGSGVDTVINGLKL